MGDTIGLVPVPPDKPLSEFIDELINRDNGFLKDKLEELEDVINQFQNNGQPENFGYAGLLNHLNGATADSVLTQQELIHLCAAAMWEVLSLYDGNDLDE